MYSYNFQETFVLQNRMKHCTSKEVLLHLILELEELVKEFKLQIEKLD